MARGFPAGSVPGKEVLGIHKLTLRSSGQGHGLQRSRAGLGRASGSSARRIYTVVLGPDLRTGSSPGPPPGVVPEPAAKPVTSVVVATWWHVMVYGRCTSWDGLSGSMHPCAAAAHPVLFQPVATPICCLVRSRWNFLPVSRRGSGAACSDFIASRGDGSVGESGA